MHEFFTALFGKVSKLHVSCTGCKYFSALWFCRCNVFFLPTTCAESFCECSKQCERWIWHKCLLQSIWYVNVIVKDPICLWNRHVKLLWNCFSISQKFPRIEIADSSVNRLQWNVSTVFIFIELHKNWISSKCILNFMKTEEKRVWYDFQSPVYVPRSMFGLQIKSWLLSCLYLYFYIALVESHEKDFMYLFCVINMPFVCM